MNVEGFVRDREASWRELDGLVARSRRRFRRLGPDDVRRLGELYRSAAADLSLARRRLPRDPLVAGAAGLGCPPPPARSTRRSPPGSVRPLFCRGHFRVAPPWPLP